MGRREEWGKADDKISVCGGRTFFLHGVVVAPAVRNNPTVALRCSTCRRAGACLEFSKAAEGLVLGAFIDWHGGRKTSEISGELVLVPSISLKQR